jgi:broad specificity phosphatase PhoE
MDSPGKYVFIVRHGQRGDVVHPDMRNPYPVPLDASLTELGKVQSARTCKLIECITKSSNCTIVTSPFLGCVETSLAIKTGLTPIIDWHFCDFLHILAYPMNISEEITCKSSWFQSKFGDFEILGEAPDYPEDYSSMKTRVLEGFQHWINHFETDTLVIVTHLMPLEILSQFMKEDENIRLTDDGFCCVTIAKLENGSFQCFVVADHTHAPQYIKN